MSQPNIPPSWLDPILHPPGPQDASTLAGMQASNPALTHISGTPAPPSAVGGGSFRIDLARAPQAIKELQDALEQLEGIKQDAMELSKFGQARAGDSVSADMAQLIGATAAAGPGSLFAAASVGIAEIRKLIDVMQQDIAGSRETNTDNAAKFERVDRA